MNQFFRQLPLLAKLLLIALIPIAFIIYLTIVLYREKATNVAQLRDHIARMEQSANITRLIDQLQRERRYSYEYALKKERQLEMLAQRPHTDSLIETLRRRHDRSLEGFETYSFLKGLDSVRNGINQGVLGTNQVMHFYSSTIFRLNTLNRVPLSGDRNFN